MKHEVISNPSTENVIKMIFECKTFDEANEEKSTKLFEMSVKDQKQTVDGYVSTENYIRAIPI
jgi:hypothetical protein